MNKNLVQIAIWIKLFFFFLIASYHQAHAQLQKCAPATIVSTATGYNASAGYNQLYVLVNSSGNVVATSPTGSFSNVAAGNYTVHALNYDIGNPPSGVDAVTNSITAGTALSAIGGGCMDNDFFTDYKSYSVTSCNCSANATFCSTDPVIGTTNNYNSFYSQVYFLTTTGGIIISYNTTGNFGTLAVGSYRIYALNYNPSNPPSPLVTALSVFQIGNATTGCYNEDFLTDYMCVSVINCTCAPTDICKGSNISPTMTGFNAAYSQWYVLVDDATGNILEVTNQNPPSFSTNGLTLNHTYSVHALNFNPVSPPDPLPIIGQPLSSVASISAGCMNNDFFTDKKCFRIIDCCVPVDICQGRPIVVGTTGQNNTAGYQQTFLLTNNNGVVLATTNSNPTAFPTGSLTIGNTYRVYALNYQTTNPPSIIPISIGTTDVDLISGGCYDIVGSGNQPYKCFVITSAVPTNPSAVTQSLPTSNTLPSCISPPSNNGQVFSQTVTNNCVPPLNIGINARTNSNGVASTGILTPSSTTSCGGTLNFNNAPIIYALQCSNDGLLSINVSAPTNVSGTITNFEAALYGPLTNPLPCPIGSIPSSNATFVDCNNNNGSSPIGLSYSTAQDGQVWLVLIDTDGGMGDFVISGAGIALPAADIILTGQNLGSLNHLVWTTEREVNLHHFEIERSINNSLNTNFKKIGQRDAVGNTNGLTSYDFDDIKPELGVNFYRIKAIDTDGSEAYSNTIQISIQQLGNIYIYPNPATTELTVEVLGGIGSTQFQLYNSLGQVVISENWEINTTGLYKIGVSDLASGTYFYKISNNGKTITGKVNKE